MDHDTTADSSSDTMWPEFEADKLLRGSSTRSLTLDTQRASSDGRLLEITSQLDLIRTRLGSLEQFVLETPASSSTIDDLTMERLNTFELSISQTLARFDELANRVSQSEDRVTTTVVSTVDGFDTRVALIEDARLAQNTEINELTGYLEQAFTRITELAQVIENNNTAHLDTISEVENRLDSTQTRASVAALESALNELTKRVDESNAQVTTQLNEISEAATAPLVDLEARISAQADKLIQQGERFQALQERTDESFTTQTERIDKHETELGHQYEDLTRFREVLSEQGATLKAHEQTIEGLTNTAADGLAHEDLLTSQSETLSRHDASITELYSQLDAAQTESSKTDKADLEAHARSIAASKAIAEHAEQIAQDNGDRIMSIVGTNELLGQRIDLLEAESLDSSQSTSALANTLASRVDETQSGLRRVGEIVEAVDERIDTANESIQSTHARIDGLETTTNESIQSAHARIDERIDTTNESIQSTHARIDERIDTTNESIQSAHARIDELETAESSQSASSPQEQEELRSELQDTQSRVTAAVATTKELEIAVDMANNELRDKIENLTESEAEFKAQITQIDERVESVETQIKDQTRQASNDETAIVASDAKDLAENLRIIQTNVVQTFKGELNTHENRLSQLEQTHESAGELASAERVQQLETKLVEALQTISQLTQLQRRHTTVETQITDALGATNQGVEHTQSHVVALRSELDQANTRIARLEAALSATAGQVAQPVTPAAPATVHASTAPVEPSTASTETAQPISDVEFNEDGDTSWFAESYERRNAS